MVAGFSCGLQNRSVPYGMEYLTGVPYGMEYCDERGAAGFKIAREGQDCQVNACFPSDLGQDATPPKAVLCAVNSRCDTQIKCCPSWVLVGESLQIQGAVTSLFCGRSLSSQFMS